MNKQSETLVPQGDVEEAWKRVKNAVDYPVYLLNAYYKDDENFVNANGETNTGKDKHFNLVVVDKLNDGNKQVVSAVTGQYGTVVTKDVYCDLHSQLLMSDQKHHIVGLFISGNGGNQSLLVEMDDMMDISCTPDALAMRMRLVTSVDGTTAHTLSMVVHNKKGDISQNVYGGQYKLSARHTNTINQRTIEFIPSLNLMVKNWNDLIMPTMNLIYNQKYNRKAAVEMVELLAGDAGIGERHRVNIRELYESGGVRTNDTTDSLYKINTVINQYIEDEMSDKKELQERFKVSLSKALQKQIKKLK